MAPRGETISVAEDELKVVIACLSQVPTKSLGTTQAAIDVGITKGALEKRLERFQKKYKDINAAQSASNTANAASSSTPVTSAADTSISAAPSKRSVAKPKKRKMKEAEMEHEEADDDDVDGE